MRNLMKWRWPSSSYSCWLLLMIWLTLTFMTFFFLEHEVGSKIVTSIFCQSSMSPDHSGVGVQSIHISHTSPKSNPNFPKTPPKPPSPQPIHEKIPSQKAVTYYLEHHCVYHLWPTQTAAAMESVNSDPVGEETLLFQEMKYLQTIPWNPGPGSSNFVKRVAVIYMLKICYHMYLILRQWLSKGTRKQ